MNTKRLLSILSVVIGLMLMASCEYEFIEVPPPPPPPEPGDTTSYAEEVAPIFVDDGCTVCHNGGMAFDLTPPNSYNNIMNLNLAVPFKPEDSKIYTYPHPVTGDHNNKYKSQDHADTIYTWIMQGALDN